MMLCKKQSVPPAAVPPPKTPTLSGHPHIRVAGHERGRRKEEDDRDGEPVCRVPPSIPQAWQ